VAKIFFLGSATLFSHRIASAFEAGNPSRLAWRLLGIGLLGFLLGQSYLAFFQFVLGRSSPYPSPADAGFMAGYPFLLSSPRSGASSAPTGRPASPSARPASTCSWPRPPP
jgi:hypothetical protein